LGLNPVIVKALTMKIEPLEMIHVWVAFPVMDEILTSLLGMGLATAQALVLSLVSPVKLKGLETILVKVNVLVMALMAMLVIMPAYVIDAVRIALIMFLIIRAVSMETIAFVSLILVKESNYILICLLQIPLCLLRYTQRFRYVQCVQLLFV